jgi:hypothetical protein
MRFIFTITLILLFTLPGMTIAAETPEISRAAFCTSIVDREPGDAPESINTGLQSLYFFNEILNGKDSIVSHRWFYNDIQIADVSLNIGADRWRTWSTKQVWHLTAGTLKVQVVSSGGDILVEKEITIQ